MAGVAQLVRALDCGSRGRRFNSAHSPHSLINASNRFTFLRQALGEIGRNIEMATSSVVNLDQQQFWNEVKGDFWVTLKTRIDALLLPFGMAALKTLNARPSERVLEIGCGTGATSTKLAELVGSRGEVLAVDLSKPMLDKAKASRPEKGANVLTYREADAEVYPFAGNHYDAVFSRFGVMFFDDPIAAFRNIRLAVRPKGRLAYVCWASRKDNPWIRVPTGASRPFLEIPAAPPQDSPGQFAMEREERITEILLESGWSDITIKKFEIDHCMGTTLNDAASFICQMGPMSEPFAGATSRVKAECIAAVEGALQPFEGKDGVRMKFSTWVVGANNV